MAKEIKYTQRFMRHYRGRIAKDADLKQQFIESVDTFLADPAAVVDHQLGDKMVNKRAFSVTNDIRVVYRDNDEFFIFLDIGTHEQVYLR